MKFTTTWYEVLGLEILHNNVIWSSRIRDFTQQRDMNLGLETQQRDMKF